MLGMVSFYPLIQKNFHRKLASKAMNIQNEKQHKPLIKCRNNKCLTISTINLKKKDKRVCMAH